MKRNGAATILGSAGAAAAAAALTLFLAPAAPGPRSDADSGSEVATLRREVARLEDEVAALREATATPVEGAPEPVRTVEVEAGRPRDALAARCDELTAQCAELTARCSALEQRLPLAEGFLCGANAESVVTTLQRNANAHSFYGFATLDPTGAEVRLEKSPYEVAISYAAQPLLPPDPQAILRSSAATPAEPQSATESTDRGDR